VYDHTSLNAWIEARAVASGVLGLSRAHWKPWAAAVFAQLQRASLSVQLNITEGWTFHRSATYARHLSIAYGSAVETGELIVLAVDAEAIPKDLGEQLLCRNRRSQRLLLGLLKSRRPLG